MLYFKPNVSWYVTYAAGQRNPTFRRKGRCIVLGDRDSVSWIGEERLAESLQVEKRDCHEAQLNVAKRGTERRNRV